MKVDIHIDHANHEQVSKLLNYIVDYLKFNPLPRHEICIDQAGTNYNYKLDRDEQK